MGKYIKGIFSIFIVFTIIKPIFYIKDNDFKYETILNPQNIELQHHFIDYINKEKIDEYEEYCNEILQKKGINNAVIEINYTFDNEYQIKIEEVLVNLKNSVIISDKEHIDIIKEIKLNVASYLNVNEGLVKVYE